MRRWDKAGAGKHGMSVAVVLQRLEVVVHGLRDGAYGACDFIAVVDNFVVVFFVRVFAGGHGGVCADAAVGYAVVLFVPAVYFAVAVYFHPVATYAVGSEVAVLALQYCDMVVRHAYPAEFHAGNFGWRVHM